MVLVWLAPPRLENCLQTPPARLSFEGLVTFAQNHLADFAGAGFGQRLGAELDDARQLELAEEAFQVGEQFLLGQVRARLEVQT